MTKLSQATILARATILAEAARRSHPRRVPFVDPLPLGRELPETFAAGGQQGG